MCDEEVAVHERLVDAVLLPQDFDVDTRQFDFHHWVRWEDYSRGLHERPLRADLAITRSIGSRTFPHVVA